MCSLCRMCHWTISRQSILLLLGVLTVIVLVLVLPQVDLLDTAFQRGTAPILVHSQGTTKPPFQTLSGLFVFALSVAGVATRSERCLPSLGIHEARILNPCFRC